VGGSHFRRIQSCATHHMTLTEGNLQPRDHQSHQISFWHTRKTERPLNTTISMNMSDAIDMHELLEVLRDKSSLDLLTEVSKLRTENEQLKRLKMEADNLRTENEQLTGVVGQLRNQFQGLLPRIEDIQTRQQQNEADIEQLKVDTQRLNEKMGQLEKKHEKLDQEFKLIKKKQGEVEDNACKQNCQFRRKNQDVCRDKPRAEKTEKDMQNLQRKFDKAIQSLRNKNAEIRRLKDKLRKYEAKP
jgi:chromosome segregation ATPase